MISEPAVVGRLDAPDEASWCDARYRIFSSMIKFSFSLGTVLLGVVG